MYDTWTGSVYLGASPLRGKLQARDSSRVCVYVHVLMHLSWASWYVILRVDK